MLTHGPDKPSRIPRVPHVAAQKIKSGLYIPGYPVVWQNTINR